MEPTDAEPASNSHLKRLVERGAAEELFALVTVDDMAAAWVAYSAAFGDGGGNDSRDLPGQWASSLWYEEWWWKGNAERVREGLLALIRAADGDDELLGAIGAGPLENFITDDQADLRWIEEQAGRSPAFRRALRGVWVTNVYDETYNRLCQAADGELVRFADDA